MIQLSIDRKEPELSRNVDVNIYFGQKKVRVTGLVIIATLAVVIACIGILVMIPGRGVATVAGARKLVTDERYIIHAGGFVEGSDGQMLDYTNSLEALNNCYDSGNRICEFDFMITSDDGIVCAHGDDNEVTWAHGIENAGWKDNPPTFSTFMASQFAGCLTTMSLDDLASFMKQHGDFYVVTDVKDDNIIVCREIRERYPELLNNFIIQIYHQDEYEKIRDLGFTYIIYTLYRATDVELLPESLTEFAHHANPVGICFWADFPEQYPESFEALKETGLPLLVHTVNDKEEMKKFFDIGISAIYTDVVNKEDQFN